MEINRLKYFATVVEAGHLRNAAKLLRISPGALSKAMQVLEAEINLKLFTPSGRSIAVTDQGMIFYRNSLPLLREFEHLRASLVSTAGVKSSPKRLRIGSFEVFTSYFLCALIEDKFRDEAISAVELTPGKIEQALLDRDIDIGITYAAFPNQHLDFMRVATFEFGLFGRQDRYADVSWSELPFAVPTTAFSHPAISMSSLDSWPDHEFPRTIRYEFELLETALQTSRAGLSVLHCPRFIARLHNKVTKEEFHLQSLKMPVNFQKQKQDIYLVKRKTDLESDTIKKIAAAVRSICKY